MAIVDMQYRTITCNGTGCDKTVTYDIKVDPIKDNPWLENARVVNCLADGRLFAYCSDTCEVKSVTAGTHNKVSKNVIEMPQGAALDAIRKAAQAAKAAEEGAKALKEGRSANIQIRES